MSLSPFTVENKHTDCCTSAGVIHGTKLTEEFSLEWWSCVSENVNLGGEKIYAPWTLVLERLTVTVDSKIHFLHSEQLGVFISSISLVFLLLPQKHSVGCLVRTVVTLCTYKSWLHSWNLSTLYVLKIDAPWKVFAIDCIIKKSGLVWLSR